MVAYLSGKNTNMQQKVDPNMKRIDKVKILVKQYEDLIRLLKEQGALLNSIRP